MDHTGGYIAMGVGLTYGILDEAGIIPYWISKPIKFIFKIVFWVLTIFLVTAWLVDEHHKSKS